MPRTVSSLLALSFVLTLAANAQEQGSPPQTDSLRFLETLTIIGVAGGRHNVGGSIDYLDAEALDIQSHSDILRILRVVPGVNIQEEEGYGLRPNIGLRGSGSDRNSRIMIMEDGIPIAPAVYASPSAYYFPSTARINAVEVTKGPAVIQYGPRTTGGAIHLFSTPIPEDTQGYAEILWGDYGRQRLHANLGTRRAITEALDFGILIETYQDEADGFLERDTAGADTGFDVSDYVIKTGLYADGAVMPWSLELKYQAKDEASNQTYLGLIESDFNADPLRLYDAAQNDQMNNQNELFQLTGTLAVNSDTTITAIAYSNEVARNWYKLEGVNAAGNGASGDIGIGNILADPVTYSAELDLIRGVTSLDNSLVIRANNRKYYSRGLSLNLDTELRLGGLTHHLNTGIRVHEDQEDRFQKEDAYRLSSGRLSLTSGGAAGGTTNRVTDAKAVSFFVLDRVEFTDRFQITGGFRFENYEVTRLDFSTADPTRAAGPARTRSNSNDVILPSLSAVFNLTDEVDLIGGIHKGFSPAGASTANNEESWQYEVGARFSRGELDIEGVTFFN
ncbi:MAG: TonB-dependent receptor, partial [Henriciella sp.]|nr:TonB-dependent receptor [Henriciella sp.]